MWPAMGGSQRLKFFRKSGGLSKVPEFVCLLESSTVEEALWFDSHLTKVYLQFIGNFFFSEMELRTMKEISEKYRILSMAQFKVRHYLYIHFPKTVLMKVS